MALYEYRCTQCGFDIIATHRADKLTRVCVMCGNRVFQRKWSISFKRSMPEHFNRTVNAPVSNERQFADKLKQGSEDYFKRTGIETKFVPVDMDPASVGVTSEGLTGEAARRAERGNSKGAAARPPDLPKNATEARRVAEEYLARRPHMPDAPEPSNVDEKTGRPTPLDLPAEK